MMSKMAARNYIETTDNDDMFDSNLDEEDFVFDERPKITNGVIFSKIWSTKELSQPVEKRNDKFKVISESGFELKSNQSKENIRKKSK